MAAVLLAAAGLWLGLTEHAVLLSVAGWIAVVSFGASAVWIALQLASRRPLLVVDDDGFDDHSTAVGVGRVSWSEVTALEAERVGGQGFVSVTLGAPNVVLGRMNPLRRTLLKLNAKITGRIVALPSVTLGVPAEELAGELRRRRAGAG